MSGRGSWTEEGGTYKGFYAYIPGFPLVGSQVRGKANVDPDYDNYRAVWAGVKAIQHAINSWQPGTVIEDGTFGIATGIAVRSFQAAKALTVDGEVGPRTAWQLFRPMVVSTEARYKIPGRALAGVLALESEGFDPGSVGEVNAGDKGLAQFNTDGADSTWWNTRLSRPEETLTPARAFDSVWAVDQAAARMAYYRERYASKGLTLQNACSIAQHNAPGWADIWFRTGVAPNSSIAAYVKVAQERAATYQ